MISSNLPLVVSAIGVFRPRDPGAAVNRSLSATGSTDIVNVTEAGKLLGILLNVTAGVTGTPTMRLEIVVDGGTQENIPIYTASNTWEDFFRRLVGAMSAVNSIDGDTGSNAVYLLLDCLYDTSLVVRVNTTTAGSAGAVDLWVVRATKQ